LTSYNFCTCTDTGSPSVCVLASALVVDGYLQEESSSQWEARPFVIVDKLF
jgi:hypothetical protein